MAYAAETLDVKSKSSSSHDEAAFTPYDPSEELRDIQDLRELLQTLSIDTLDDFVDEEENALPRNDADMVTAFKADINQAKNLAENIKKAILNPDSNDVSSLKSAIKKVEGNKAYEDYLVGGYAQNLGTAKKIHEQATKSVDINKRIAEMTSKIEEKKQQSGKDAEAAAQRAAAAEKNAEDARNAAADFINGQAEAQPKEALIKFYTGITPDADLDAIARLYDMGARFDAEEKAVIFENKESGRTTIDTGTEVNTFIDKEGAEFGKNDALMHLDAAIAKGDDTITVYTENKQALALIEKMAKERGIKVIHAPSEKMHAENDNDNALIAEMVNDAPEETNGHAHPTASQNGTTSDIINLNEDLDYAQDVDFEEIEDDYDDVAQDNDDLDGETPANVVHFDLTNDKKEKSFKENKEDVSSNSVFGFFTKKLNQFKENQKAKKERKATIASYDDKITDIAGNNKSGNDQKDGFLKERFRRINSMRARHDRIDALNEFTLKNDLPDFSEQPVVKKAVETHGTAELYHIVIEKMKNNKDNGLPMDDSITEIGTQFNCDLNNDVLVSAFGTHPDVAKKGMTSDKKTFKNGTLCPENAFIAFASAQYHAFKTSQADRANVDHETKLALTGNAGSNRVLPIYEIPVGVDFKTAENAHTKISSRAGAIWGKFNDIVEEKNDLPADLMQKIDDLHAELEAEDALARNGHHATINATTKKTAPQQKLSNG